MKRASLTDFFTTCRKKFLHSSNSWRQRLPVHKNDLLRHIWEPIFMSLFRKKVSLSGVMFMGVEKPQQPVNICNGLTRCKIEMTLNISHTLIWGVHWKLLPQSSYIFWTEFVDQSLVQAGSTQIQASPVGMEPQTRRCFLCPFDPKRKYIRTWV